METDSVTKTTQMSLIGRVKWFNTKSGYGFITITDGEQSGNDIFVHHSAVVVSDEQYRYLVQGEYVQFELVSVEGGKHEIQATNVSGIKGGKLMCETRNEFKSARKNYKSHDGDSVSEQAKTPRSRGEGPRDAVKQQWTTVNNRASTNTPRKQRTPRVVAEK
jgi:CspA family cold shock protein